MVQLIPSRCDLFGNEDADRVTKSGSWQPQQHTVSYGEAKIMAIQEAIDLPAQQPHATIIALRTNHL